MKEERLYTIGEVAEMLNLPISTLRYYDKEGLLITIERDSSSGVRKFNQQTLEALRLIECLKKSGMQIKAIKEFMYWCTLGSRTITKRKQMFIEQRKNIEREIAELEKALAMIKYKCWYYCEAEKDGDERRVKNISLEQMPSCIREAYEKAFLD